MDLLYRSKTWRQQQYSDLAIETVLTLRSLFQLDDASFRSRPHNIVS